MQEVPLQVVQGEIRQSEQQGEQGRNQPEMVVLPMDMHDDAANHQERVEDYLVMVRTTERAIGSPNPQNMWRAELGNALGRGLFLQSLPLNTSREWGSTQLIMQVVILEERYTLGEMVEERYTAEEPKLIKFSMEHQ